MCKFAIRCFGVSVSVAALATAASAQSFTNGNFETGSLSGWTVAATSNGATNVQQAVQYDIDGGGALGTNFAANFEVGQSVFTSGDLEGISLTQSMTLVGGTTYNFSFNWSSHCSLPAINTNADGGQYAMTVNGASIGGYSVGSIQGQSSQYGVVSGSFTAASSGNYTVGASIQRIYLASGTSVDQYVDNFSVAPVPEPASLSVIGLGLAALLRRRKK